MQDEATEASACPSGRHLEAEEGLYLPEEDRASLHDSDGVLKLYVCVRERESRGHCGKSAASQGLSGFDCRKEAGASFLSYQQNLNCS